MTRFIHFSNESPDMLMRNPNYPLDVFEVDTDFAAIRREAIVKFDTAGPIEDVSDSNQLGGQLILCLLFATAIALRSWFAS